MASNLSIVCTFRISVAVDSMITGQAHGCTSVESVCVCVVHTHDIVDSEL